MDHFAENSLLVLLAFFNFYWGAAPLTLLGTQFTLPRMRKMASPNLGDAILKSLNVNETKSLVRSSPELKSLRSPLFCSLRLRTCLSR